MKLSDIDFSKIKLPEVKEVLKDQMAHGAVCFKDLKTTEPTSENKKSFGTVEDRFEINQPVQKVFNHYLTMNPADVWKQGSLLGYEFTVDKNTEEVFYHEDHYPGARVGQILYMHSNMWGMHKLCMAQEIIHVDPVNYTITFSYIDWGMTKGTQTIQLNKISETKTELTHLSYFKGVSAFRDKFYPFFHSLIVKRMHKSVLATLR